MDSDRSYSAIRDASVEATLARELPALARSVAALNLSGVAGLALGGGYGRGEGGAKDGRPYNDLDIFVFSDLPEGRSGEIAGALEPVSREYTDRLGVDVDFTVRVAARLRLDERRLMVQELLRGHEVLSPEGFDLARWAGLREYPAAEVPAMEAARLLMNRGMGLAFASGRFLSPQFDPERDGGFVARNLNKAVLGAGDAVLVARGEYAWSVRERAKRLADAGYDEAVSWKFSPSDRAPSEFPRRWRAARVAWLAAEAELVSRCGGELSRRSLYQALRWLKRRHSAGRLSETGLDCTVRVLREVRKLLERCPDGVPEVPAGLLRDWQTFN